MPVEGDTLGDYVLGRALGRGTSGTVHVARHRPSGGWVALKILASVGDAAGTDRDELRARFLQETVIARRLRHPDIVAVHEAGEAAGVLWFAMDFVRGHSADRYILPRYQLPPPIVLQIGIRVARALAHAHSLGVVHRDIKPSNILIDLPGDGVKLTDFGTARVEDGNRTRTGVMLGTPAYMAPEQLGGAPADARSDLYSLGVVLFELLTARRPHQAASMGELLRQVVAEPAPDLRQIWPQAPAALAHVLASLLAKRPAARPAAAADLADALERARLHVETPDAAP